MPAEAPSQEKLDPMAANSGIGIYLNNTAFVTLRKMSLSNFENLGVFGTSVNGFHDGILHYQWHNWHQHSIKRCP